MIGDNDMFKVDVMVRPNKDGWWAEITSLPGCFSGGESLEVLKLNMASFLPCYLPAVVFNEFYDFVRFHFPKVAFMILYSK